MIYSRRKNQAEAVENTRWRKGEEIKRRNSRDYSAVRANGSVMKVEDKENEAE